ncbi:methyltransferase domain-containing protein [Nakamurella deserti]|uniref:methyltransferase domain-containing protein n=1 Tax=Nakamurella deserti TaxID=2164074 RepID=UPI00130025CD|nr:methyltransferase domain-containing protein [Nakamurella deserti]
MGTPQEPSSADGPAGLRLFQRSAQDDESVQRMLTLLDMQDTAPGIERLRRWALEVAAPRRGETVVDVGSGTGTVVRRLAGVVGPGLVTGIEPNPRLRAVAEERTPADPPGVAHRHGTATDLPFDDGSVDLVWCERVLQHLYEPAAAVAEIARVLRPGGRAVLLDSDHRTRVTSDVDPDVDARLLGVFLASQPNPSAARRIPRQVRDAGLVLDPDIGSSALIFPAALVAGSALLELNAAAAVERGAVTRVEADEAVRRFRAAAAEGVAFSAVTVFGFLARKPGAADDPARTG